MIDVVDKATRSRMMSGIKGKNTKPELLIRKELFRLGYRYRLHVKNIPGKPDISLPKHKTVIFIDGCFWHCHKCHLFKCPQTQIEFWKEKLSKNVERDRNVTDELLKEGWRVLRIYECAIKGKTKRSLKDIVDSVVEWLESPIKIREITGVEKCK